jgi:hypothetical protein
MGGSGSRRSPAAAGKGLARSSVPAGSGSGSLRSRVPAGSGSGSLRSRVPAGSGSGSLRSRVPAGSGSGLGFGLDLALGFAGTDGDGDGAGAGSEGSTVEGSVPSDPRSDDEDGTLDGGTDESVPAGGVAGSARCKGSSGVSEAAGETVSCGSEASFPSFPASIVLTSDCTSGPRVTGTEPAPPVHPSRQGGTGRAMTRSCPDELCRYCGAPDSCLRELQGAIKRRGRVLG